MDLYNRDKPDKKPVVPRRKIDIHPYKVQTMDSYVKDSIVAHLESQIEVLSSHGFHHLGRAQQLEYRERAYPNLFPRSIDMEPLNGDTTKITLAYQEFVEKESRKGG